MNKGVSGIYEIRSIAKPEMFYIGSSNDIRARINQHRLQLRKRTHFNPKLQRHRDEYGTYDLVFNALACCDECNLKALEQHFIDVLIPTFNISKTAEWHGIKGKRVITVEERKNRSISHMGHSVSEETRRKLSEKGKLRATDEFRQKISDRMSGGKHPMFGKHWSQEARDKIGAGRRLYYEKKRKGFDVEPKDKNQKARRKEKKK